MAEFTSTWPRMVGEGRRRGTVRTTNGDTVTGLLESDGTAYAIDVETDDGRCFTIAWDRVAEVAVARRCYHPLSCLTCNRLGRACGKHVVGTVCHEHCVGEKESA